MYLYMITNLVNNKKYIGITNNIQRRWANHKCNNDPTMVIAKAIKKYGVQNFKFEVLVTGIPIDKIDQYEQEYIAKYHTHVSEGQGYNVSRGGRYFKGVKTSVVGERNGNAHLTKEEVGYIKSHRNLPLYVLYDDFAEKIGYQAFKDIYHDKTYKNIRPTVDEYPYNLEFSGQFASNHKLDYDEVIELRKQYAQHIPWKTAYKQYQDRYPDPLTFWNIYNGNVYRLVMPEVFTLKNKKAHTSIRACKGQNNGRAKLTWDIVRQIRKDYSQGVKTRKQIQEEHPEITPTSINNILRGATWQE